MFAHPATHHVGRVYTGINPSAYPTTGRKNVNKENAGVLPTKTPSRVTKGGLPATSLRPGLGMKSVIRDGNVMRSNNDGKGKVKEEDIAPKRLFASTTSAGPSKTGLAPSKSFGSLQHIIQSTKKTPGPSRQQTLRTPAPAAVPPTPLPSAGRARRRSRQSLTPSKPVEPKTPAPSGHWWDEEVSFGSLGEVGLELDDLAEVDEPEGDDEVEYMPPPLPEIEWKPPFDLPDVKHAFEVLSRVPPLWTPFEDPVIQIEEPSLQTEAAGNIELCDENELEEPMFRRAKPAPAPATSSKPAVRFDTKPRPAASSIDTHHPLPSSLSRATGARPGANLVRQAGVRNNAPARVTPSQRPAVSRPPAARPVATSARTVSTKQTTVASPPPNLLIAPIEVDDVVLPDEEFSLDMSD